MPSVESNPTNPTSSKSGIVSSASGERHIPSSLRPDGSVRKEIKIKPGYRPPEDVEVYKNRSAESWKNRGSGGVPGAASLKEADSEKPGTAASDKNAKRREARKRAKAAELEKEGESVKDGDDGNPTVTDLQLNDDPESTPSRTPTIKVQSTAAEAPANPDPEKEKEKEAKKLMKKLRQARDLKEKKEKGDSLLPEQFAKVIKIQELIRDLDKLGFDAEGNKKE
jgi:partner of Y14 and mago